MWVDIFLLQGLMLFPCFWCAQHCMSWSGSHLVKFIWIFKLLLYLGVHCPFPQIWETFCYNFNARLSISLAFISALLSWVLLDSVPWLCSVVHGGVVMAAAVSPYWSVALSQPRLLLFLTLLLHLVLIYWFLLLLNLTHRVFSPTFWLIFPRSPFFADFLMCILNWSLSFISLLLPSSMTAPII